MTLVLIRIQKSIKRTSSIGLQTQLRCAMSSAVREAATRIRILVVDEDPNLAAVVAALEAPDREVLATSSSAEALTLLAAHDVAVLVLAAQLEGVSTAARVKSSERSRHIPILMVTEVGHDRAHVRQAYDSGAVDVIQRIDVDILRIKVAVFTELYRVRDQVRRQEVARVASLAQAGQLHQQFLSTLGEELRPPLNVILGWIRMLREGSMREPQRTRALETVERHARAQLELIEEIIDISRMTAGTLALELSTLNLAELVDAAVEAVRPAAIEKQVTLFAALDPDVRPMSGDPERLRQVVHRLVSNAIASTPTEGVITVSLGNQGSEVELAVTDTGVGIDPALVPRVFDPQAADPGVAGAFGVGLAIVRHLVELHDGKIRVESAGIGLGCRFVVGLPAVGRPPRTDDELR